MRASVLVAALFALAACASRTQAPPPAAVAVAVAPPSSALPAAPSSAPPAQPPPGPPSPAAADASITACCAAMSCTYNVGQSSITWESADEQAASLDCVVDVLRQAPIVHKMVVLGATKARILEQLAHVPGLRSLDLEVGDASLAPIASATGLRDLHLAAGPSTHDFGALAALPLDVLEIDVKNAGSASVREVARATNATSLSLFLAEAADLAPLGAMSRLHQLSVSTRHVDVDLAPLAAVRALETLVVDVGMPSKLAGLASLRQVRSLAISSVDPLGLAPVGRLTDLSQLSLAMPGTSDLSPLGGLAKLQSLMLQMSAVTSIAPLGRLRGLMEVDLRQTAVRDPRPLAACKDLRTITLPTSVPLPAARALADRFPSATIYRDER